MAEARAAIAEPHVKFHEEGTSIVEQEERVAKSLFQDLRLCAFRTRIQIQNGLWPTTWHNLAIALIVASCIMYIDHPKLNAISSYMWAFGDYIYLDNTYPYFLRLFVIAFIISVIYFIVLLYTRQYLLRMLLSWKGWLYQPPRSQSIVTILWALMVRLVSGKHARLYSYQNSLPRMSVPPLKDTVDGFLRSVRPVLEDEQYKKMEKDAKEFLSTTGPKIQRILKLKSWWAPNYHTDWWEKYVYLMGRSPITINSNYYCLDQSGWIPTKLQTSRAAGMIFFLLEFKRQIATEELEPLVIRETIPLCMWQYERVFGTSRIPGEEIDEIQHNPGSEHIVVFSNGIYYKMYVVDAHGVPLGILDIESQLEWIKKDSQQIKATNDAELKIASLTSNERTHWAKVRKEHFAEGSNKDSLDTINESLFVLVLEDKQFEEVSDRAKYLLHGDAKSVWYDKSFNVIVFEDGRLGINAEHSWADAPVVGHMVEIIFTQEFLYRVYNDQGRCKPFGGYTDKTFRRSKAKITPMRLYWDITPPLAKIINDAEIFALKNNEDLEIVVRIHSAFGKGFIKTCKMSPDAYIQIALQMAYYKDSNGKFALTYESCMTRLYLHGRTETVRSLSQEMRDFILSLKNDDIPKKEKINLIQKAAKVHQKCYRDGMSGKGIDRHLFSLLVVSRGQGYESPFLMDALMLPWTLSTSQQPQQQMNRGFDIGIPEVRETISPGGGFGPVADDGYGVSYMVPDDRIMYFHVSSKKSSPHTNSERFIRNVFESLQELKDLMGTK
eukprot:Seg418.12 transcript_id=Seg418.12/GoldUCD/mRNA.D3Y31 product="Carnitine O-palmitoyltransferase 1 liver isoform" protein_id=Seg418.12/GoldUCD/D3Y31